MSKEQKKEGKSLKKSLLENFLEKHDGGEFSYRGFKLVRRRLIYEGREHDDYEVIIEKDDEYFRFTYFVDWGGTSLGKFRVKAKNDLGERYFCEKVHPVERTVIDYE
jgi:hypothetical protein